MKRLSRVLSFLSLALLVSAPVFAQGTGTLSGKVLGRDGQPAANIQVRVDQLYTNNGRLAIRDQQVVKTGKNGEYGLSGIQNGRITVTVLENGQPTMVQGEKVGDEIYIANGLDKRIPTFDLSKAPAPVAAAPAADTKGMSAADREALKKKLEAEAAAGVEAGKAFDAGKLAYAAKDYPEAIKQFLSAAEKNPSQHVIWANLGKTYDSAKQYEDAMKSYQKAIDLNPIESNYYLNLSLAQLGAGKVDESKVSIEKAASLNPANAGQAYYNLGAALINRNKYDEAVAPLKKAIELDPKYAPAYFQLGLSAVSKGETAAGIEYMQKCLDLGTCPDAATAKGLIEALKATQPASFSAPKAPEPAKSGQPAKAQPGKGSKN